MKYIIFEEKRKCDYYGIEGGAAAEKCYSLKLVRRSAEGNEEKYFADIGSELQKCIDIAGSFCDEGVDLEHAEYILEEYLCK